MFSQAQLSPPWYTLWNEIKASIGNDPGVTVNPLVTSQHPFVVPITVTDHNKAVGVASIMSAQYTLGNITVVVQVKDGSGQIVKPVVPGSPDDLVKLMQAALTGNKWFVEVVKKAFTPLPHSPVVVYPVFSKAVIQFFNDDLSDLYSNYNNVVAFVFKLVLNPAPGGIPVYSSTAKS